MERAIDELDTYPKYSIINFYSGLEIFLKARLMAEHWSLIVVTSRNGAPDIEKFEEGDFKSVSLSEAKNRLEKSIRFIISKDEYDAFDECRKHRNKMVHFFHEAQSSELYEKMHLKQVAQEQIVAWFYLHQFLTERWWKLFRPWEERLEKITKKLIKHHSFLHATFISVSPEIETLKKEGYNITFCPACLFQSYKLDKDSDSSFKSRCLVCDVARDCFRFDCLQCNHKVIFEGEGYATCQGCNESYTPEYLKTICYVEQEDILGNCSMCMGYHSVVNLDHHDSYICTECLYPSSKLEECDYCGELNNGNMEASIAIGCSHCDGKYGNNYDD